MQIDSFDSRLSAGIDLLLTVHAEVKSFLFCGGGVKLPNMGKGRSGTVGFGGRGEEAKGVCSGMTSLQKDCQRCARTYTLSVHPRRNDKLHSIHLWSNFKKVEMEMHYFMSV